MLASASTWSATRRFVRSISSSSSTSAAGALDVARRERVERDPHHLLGPLAHLGQPLDEVVVRLELGRELRQLRDRDALVADPLEVDRVVQDREHEAQVGRDGRLLREQLLDRSSRSGGSGESISSSNATTSSHSSVSCEWSDVDGAAKRAQDDRPLLLEGRLERVEAGLELDPCHRHPNRPVT